MTIIQQDTLQGGGIPDWSIQVPSPTASIPLPGGTLHTSNSSASLLTTSASNKPKILLMGQSKSGKTSIRHVVFHKMSANETQYLESTKKIDKWDISSKSFLDFELWDFPGKFDIVTYCQQEGKAEQIFKKAQVVIFVVDPLDDRTGSNNTVEKLHQTISLANKVNPDLKFEVLIHKSDSLNEDQKQESIREVTHRISRKLINNGLQEKITSSLSYKTTSIYDHSIFEAISMVCQQLLVSVIQPFESLLNAFVYSNKMEKAFIFDIHPKIFVATDNCNPFEIHTYELCCDMLDLISDFVCIYQEGEADDKDYILTSSSINLHDSRLYLKQVNRNLALICIQQGDDCDVSNHGILEYNFQLLKNGIHSVLKVANM